MKIKIHITVITLFLFISAFSENILKTPKNLNTTATIEYKTDNVNITHNDNGFATVTIDGVNGKLLQFGKPELPVDVVSVQIKGSENVEIVIDSIDYEYVKDLPPIPSKGNITRNLDPRTVLLSKDEIYSKDEWYPSSVVKTEGVFLIRNLSGISAQITPVQYNGLKGEYRIVKRVVFSVSENVLNRSCIQKEENSRAFKKIFKERFINYHDYESRSRSVSDGDKMIVITPEKYKSSVTDFVNWKNQKGIYTTVHIYPDETGSDTNEIKNFIKSKYQSDGISYVMLIGDGEDIPAYMVPVDDRDNYGSSFDSIVPGDPLYAMVSGSDLYPDLFIGRVPGDDSEQIEMILNKVINYEKYPDPSGSWYEKTVGIGSDEGDPADYQWIEDSIHNELSEYGYNILDEIFQGFGKTENDFSSYINEGRGLINFMGHGNFEGFGFSSSFWYSISYIDALTNGSKLPVVIPLACNFGQYLGREGAAEHWIENPNGGAIAIAGSTPLMDWTPPQWAQVEMNRLITMESYNSFGAYFYNGEMKMLDISVPMGEKTVKTWVYFGDPTLQLFTKKPTTMNFTFTQNRSSSITVEGENDALVTMCNTSSAIIQSEVVTSERADFSFAANIGDTIIITATKRNRVPFIHKIIIGENSPISNIGDAKKFNIVNLNSNLIQMYVATKAEFNIKALSLNGRVISNNKYNLAEGFHRIDLNSLRIPKGISIIKIESKGIQVIRRVVLR